MNIILFLIPFILLFCILEYFYRTIPNNYSIKYNYIKLHSNEIEVLLFGDSHCFYGLNPDLFLKKTFNLSNVSQTIYFDKLLFDNYSNLLPKLKQVVFCIEYTNLSQVDDTADDLTRKYFYQKFMDLDVPIISKYDIKQFSLVLSQPKEFTLKSIKKYYKTSSLNVSEFNGWANDYKKENRILPEKIAKTRAKIQEDGLIDFDVNITRIQQIINKCKKRNIEVIIVSMPQTKLFQSYLNQFKLKKIIKTCSDFELKNKDNVRYLNLFQDDRFVDEDFYDADHLNNFGAEKCSKIVNAFLEYNNK